MKIEKVFKFIFLILNLGTKYRRFNNKTFRLLYAERYIGV